MKRNLIFAILSLTIGIVLGLSIWLYDYFYPDNYVRLENGDYINVAVATNPETFPITKNTQFKIEHFYEEEQRTLIEDVGNMPILLGCDKIGVEKYLDNYMSHLSAEERAEGLAAYQLVSYKDNVICLRKTYRTPEYEGFYAKSFNGYIVILNGDEKTVYDYTQISVHLLPEDLQKDIQQGFYLEDETELYNFLETYSS